MGREVKRVALDFDWPWGEIYAGFLCPHWPDACDPDVECKDCATGWKPTEPPAGPGWQLWETVTEGSPITPVFATQEGLVQHLVDHGDGIRKFPRDIAIRLANLGREFPAGS